MFNERLQIFVSSTLLAVFVLFCSVSVLLRAMVSSCRGFWVKRQMLWMCVRYKHYNYSYSRHQKKHY